MKLKSLKTFDNLIEAPLLKTKLESENIYCFLQDEYLVATNPLYSFAVGGIKLQVKTTDYNTALAILKEDDLKSLTSDSSEKCINCGHNVFYHNYKSVKGLKGFLSMLFSFLFQTYPVYYKNVHKCKNCGYETEIK